MPTSSGCMFRSPPSSTTSAAFEVCLQGRGWLTPFPTLPRAGLGLLGHPLPSPVLPSHTPGWDWCNWELSAVQAPGAGVTTHTLGTFSGGTPPWATPRLLTG